LRNLEVTPAEPSHLADAVLALSQRPEVDDSRVGLAGFSAGASMALIAAADPRIADQLSFLSSFGGYADANRLLVDVATSTTITDGVTTPWQADPGIRTDIVSMLLAGELDPSDSSAVDDLFAATERTKAQAAIASFSSKLKDRLASISPLNFVDGIKTHVYLLHGEPDTAIPVAHAALLADQLGDRVARLTRFGEFGHGRPGQSGIGPDDLGDVVGLYLYLRDIVAATLE
jgi:dienelactone hydrolase